MYVNVPVHVTRTQVNMVRWLVKEMGADVDGINSRGRTPQQVVAHRLIKCNPDDRKAKDMEQLLVELGADQYVYYDFEVYQEMLKKNTALDRSTQPDPQSCQFTYYVCAAAGCSVRARKELKKCAGCKVVRYCSVSCQRKHWKAEHKLMCQTFNTVRLNNT